MLFINFAYVCNFSREVVKSPAFIIINMITTIFINHLVYTLWLGKTEKRLLMGDELMLETANERILLLKAGLTGKQIEELYIKLNDFKIVGNHRPVEKIEINSEINPPINNIIAVCIEVLNRDLNKDRKGMGLLCTSHAL